MSATSRPVVAPTEVQPKTTKRFFSDEYKRSILEQVDAAPHGQIGALLRREGLYSFHLKDWRNARKRALLLSMPTKPSPTSTPDERDATIARLERELARTTVRAERAEAIVSLQKKVAELLGTPFGGPSDKP
jgi:transposase-like protein